MSDEQDPIQKSVQEALDSWERSDSFAVAAQLRQLREPSQIMRAFHAITTELFARRQLSRMIWLTRSAIDFAVQCADSTSIESTRTLAYNVSANLWPGWGDEAVHPTDSDLWAALDLACFHRRMCHETQGEPAVQGNAHWLVGAFRLALGQEQAAHHDFEQARAAYRIADKPTDAAMADGYVALALSLMGTMMAEGQKRFEAAISLLKQLGDDGEFFADQLQTARRVFLSPAADSSARSMEPS